jgi:DGQHR domain-containing protein
MNQKVGYSASLVTQGDHRFYQLAMPSDILSQCTFVSTREEDPAQGFQRLLDEKRALEIAKYIDSGLGTVPTSIILSAQTIAEFDYGSKNKTVEFLVNPKSFLILDGQHRVYGFRKASSNIRVPVVIYNELSRRDESRLFIDINSKQRGVPNELLLDIKNQAEYETNEEELYRIIFDAMNNDPSSPLFGKLSASKRATRKISRVTFNAAMKSIYKTLSARDPNEVVDILSNYLFAVQSGLKFLDGDDGKLAQSIIFRGLVAFFVPVASKVKDRFGSDYSAENFEQITRPVFERIKTSKLSGNSPAKILKYLEGNLVGEFSL